MNTRCLGLTYEHLTPPCYSNWPVLDTHSRRWRVQQSRRILRSPLLRWQAVKWKQYLFVLESSLSDYTAEQKSHPGIVPPGIKYRRDQYWIMSPHDTQEFRDTGWRLILQLFLYIIWTTWHGRDQYSDCIAWIMWHGSDQYFVSYLHNIVSYSAPSYDLFQLLIYTDRLLIGYSFTLRSWCKM